MQDEITKLGEIIDVVRAAASNSDHEPELITWLNDPSYHDCTIDKLLHLREVLHYLVDCRAVLIELMETEKSHDHGPPPIA